MNGTSRPPRRWPLALTVSLGLLAFLTLRMTTLDRAGEPAPGEVAEFGLLPSHLVGGTAMSLPQYVPLPREWGALPFGAAAVPAFVLAGPSTWSLRLTAVLWHTCTLAVFALLAASLGGWRSAALFSAAWTLAPPLLVELQQFGWPSHLEACLPAGAALLALTAALRRDSAGLALFAGVLAGLAGSFAYSAAPVALAAAGVAVAASCRGWPIHPVAVTGGVVLGLAPALLQRVLWSGPAAAWQCADGDLRSVLLVVEGDHWQYSGEGALARAASLVGRDLAGMWGYGGGGEEGTALGWAVLVALVALTLAGLTRRPARVARPGLVGRDARVRWVVTRTAAGVIGLYALAALASGIELQPRYLSPLAPWALMVACGGAAMFGLPRRDAASGGRLALAVAGAALLLVSGTQVAWWDLGRGPGAGQLDRHLRGDRFALAVHERLSERPDAIQAVLREHPAQRVEALQAAGRAAQVRGSGAGAVRLSDHPVGVHPWIWEGWGIGLARDMGPSAARDLPAWMASTEADPRRRIAFGLGRGGPYHGPVALADPVPVALQREYCAGLGALQVYRRYPLFRHDPPWSARELVPGCDPDAVAIGAGMELARELLPDSGLAGGEGLLAWLHGPASDAAFAAAFECGFTAEREALEALRDEDWEDAAPPSTLEACLDSAPDSGAQGS